MMGSYWKGLNGTWHNLMCTSQELFSAVIRIYHFYACHISFSIYGEQHHWGNDGSKEIRECWVCWEVAVMWILVVGARIRAGCWIECVLRMWPGAFAARSVWRPAGGSDKAACLGTYSVPEGPHFMEHRQWRFQVLSLFPSLFCFRNLDKIYFVKFFWLIFFAISLY